MIDGGTGEDTISFSTALAGVTVDLYLGLGFGGPGADSAGDTYANVENIDGSNYDDSFTPGLGANEIDGKSGADYVDYFDDDAGLTVNLTTGLVSTGGSRAIGDRLIRIEHLSGTNLYDDDLTGSYEVNLLFGHGGDDTLEGLAGADTLDGGAGSDTARYDSSNSAVSVDLTAGTASGGHAQGDTLLNIENLIGSYANDSLTGNALANTFDGGNGFDTLTGLGGDDIFLASQGADMIDGGTGTDTYQIADSVRDNPYLATTVDLASGTSNSGASLTSIENVISGAGNDTLTGSSAANRIEGGAGNDTLSDGAGADTLLGGTGNDVFLLRDALSDFLDPGDSLDGGSGTDTLRLGTTSGHVVFDLEAGTYTRGGTQRAALNIENVDAATHASTGSFDLRGTSGVNILTGGTGDDTLEGRGGADVLTGGAGFDTVSYAGSFGGVTVDLLGGTFHGGHATGDSVSGIEAVTGSAFADNLTGDDGDNVLRGGAGADVLRGLGGLDALYGEDGDDTLWLAGGPDAAPAGEIHHGGAGTDTLVLTSDNPGARAFDLTGLTLTSLEKLAFYTDAASAGNLSVALGVGQAQAMGLQEITVLNRHGSDTFSVAFQMDGATSADISTLAAGFGSVPGDTISLTGSASSEAVTGSAAADIVTLASDSDSFLIRSGMDVVDLGDGDDLLLLDAISAPSPGASYAGGAGLDRVQAETSLTADLSGVTLAGFETLSFLDDPGVSADVTLTDTQALTAFTLFDGNAEPGTVDRLRILLGADALIDLSTLTFTDWQNGLRGLGDAVHLTDTGLGGSGQTILGTTRDDIFTSAGGDQFNGGAGDDRLIHTGGAALDCFDGGAGWDIVDYSAETGAALDLNLITGMASLGADTATVIGIEEVHGTQSDDTILADSVVNILYGHGGNDTLTGGGGEDSVYGGAGDDWLVDRDPANLIDHYDGGDGIDTLEAVEVVWGAGVLFDLMSGRQTTSNGAFLSDSFTGIENLCVGGAAAMRGDNAANELTAVDPAAANVIDGEGGNDTLFGGGGNDTLSGGFGDDMLYGEDGDDVLAGGAGDDLFDGGAGIDTVSYAEAGGRVAVFLNRADDVGSGQGADTFVSIENVIGTNFDDRITGNAGDNRLEGGRGDDVLIGLAGNDTLLGGNGADALTGSGGDDVLMGGNGDDFLDGLGGADTLLGEGGNDMILGGLGVDMIEGGGGDDEIFGFFGADVIAGGLGDDNIRADGSGDVIDGGAGHDRIVGGNGQDTLFGGSENDVLFGGEGHANGDGLRDVFVFKTAALGGGGFDIIRDFEDTIDKLDFSQSGYAAFADVLADTVQAGAHVEISLDYGGLLRINNFDLADLTAGDFLF